MLDALLTEPSFTESVLLLDSAEWDREDDPDMSSILYLTNQNRQSANSGAVSILI